MSYTKSKYIDLVDEQGKVFSRGLIDNIQSNLISYSNSPYGINFRTFGGGTVIRPGYYQFGVDFTGSALGTAPFGIGSYLRASGASDKIVVGMKTDATHYLVGIDEAGTQTAISTAGDITVQTRMNFINVGDDLYCLNGTNGLGKLSGTTYTIANALTCKFGIYFNGSLWISGNAAAANTLYKSITDTPGTFAGGDSDQLTFPEVVTGIAGSNSAVYIFGENTLSYMNSGTIRDVALVLTYSTMPLDTNGGLTNSNCVVTVGKHVYYLSKANKIKRVAPGQGPQGFDVEDLTHRLNRGIEIIMRNLETDQSNAFAYYDQDNELIKFHVRTKGSTYNDQVVVYSTMFDEFYLDTNKSFIGGVYFKMKNYTISQLEPKIYLDEAGQTDDGSPIQFEYDTKRIDEGMPYILKEIWQCRTFLSINELAVVTQEIWADGGLIDTVTINYSDIPFNIQGIGTQEIGTYEIGEDGDTSENEYDITIVREKGNLQVRAKYFQFKFKCSSLGGKCTLQNLLPRLETISELAFEQN